MLFNSYLFILLFLPITIIGYYLLNKFNNHIISVCWLIGTSLVFYAYFNVAYLWIIILDVVVNYILAKCIITLISKNKCRKKLVLILAICFNIILLGFFKYFDFMIMNVNTFFGTDFVYMNLILPLGISFMTFQQIAFLVDTYRGEVSEINFLDYTLFIVFFPKIMQGPIVYQSELIPQIKDKARKKFNSDNFAKGIMAFSYGLGKKVILADNFGSIATYGFTNVNNINSLEAIIAILAYTMQIYFDFSGYCDMAIGIGLMLNFELPDNFNYPYRATNIIDFWKRWHITLTRFLTKYIYIPLGGSRKGNVRTYINILIVFLISGIWHGVGYTFIIWGLLHGLAQCVVRLGKPIVNKIPNIIMIIINFIFINITWVIFNSSSLNNAVTMISKVFAGGFSISPELTETLSQPVFLSVLIQMLTIYGAVAVLFIFALFAVFFMKNVRDRINNFKPNLRANICCILIFTYSVLSLSGVSTFLYTNF